ncbi:hypothetical protein [Phenylobacterium sp.]|uniref:hypothetical protein n=1 Tax=Phenylobacterium sp. TaxID=1871053 RepID=UPI0035AD8C29
MGDEEAVLRSDLFAVNARITDIYAGEERKADSEAKRALEARRPSRFKGSLPIYGSALASYAQLQASRRASKQMELEPVVLPRALETLSARFHGGRRSDPPASRVAIPMTPSGLPP